MCEKTTVIDHQHREMPLWRLNQNFGLPRIIWYLHWPWYMYKNLVSSNIYEVSVVYPPRVDALSVY